MLKIQVIGRLGKDATVNTVNGKQVINFSVAHSEKFKTAKGESVERTTWIDCAKWGEQTGVAQYLTKGTQVYVEGQPEIKTYTKNDNSTGTSFACRVGLVQLLGSAAGTSNSNAGTAAEEENAASDTDAQGNKKKLPF